METFTDPNNLLTMKEIKYYHPLGKTKDSYGNLIILRIRNSVSRKNNNTVLNAQDKLL